MRTNAVTRKDDKAIIPSPVTPAVTGIDYPGDDLSTDIESRPQARNVSHHAALYTHPNIAGSTIDDVEPPQDAQSLDQLWGTIRLEKERKMAKERPKVQSLEEVVPQELLVQDHRAMQVPVMESSPPLISRSVKKQKSMYVFFVFFLRHITNMNYMYVCVFFFFKYTVQTFVNRRMVGHWWLILSYQM
jgi:hypothetical protein